MADRLPLWGSRVLTFYNLHLLHLEDFGSLCWWEHLFPFPCNHLPTLICLLEPSEAFLFSFLGLEYHTHFKAGNKSSWAHTVSRDAQRLPWQGRSQWEGGTTLLSMVGGACPNSCSFTCPRFCVILFDISPYVFKFMRNLQTLTINTKISF